MKSSSVWFMLMALIITTSCNCPPSGAPSVNCSKRGSSSLFVASFDSDQVGSPPAAPSTPLHYGPPGASLGVVGGVQVINSAVLGSQALRITRGPVNPTEIDAVVGDIGDAPYTSGVYYIEFRAHGEIIPAHLIAGMAISVRSAENKAALALKLYDGSYHLREGDSYTRLSGSYDPSTAHFVHIELNLDARRFSICIDDAVITSNKAFFENGFSNLHSLKFFAPATITEAFQSIYVTDDIRVTK